MKKLIVFILIALFLCLSGLCFEKDFVSIRNLFPNAEIELYVTNVALSDKNYITNGEGFIIFTTMEEIEDIIKTHEVIGYTLKIGKISWSKMAKILQAASVVFDGKFMYGYSNFFSNHIVINQDKVNFQCVFLHNKTLIGTPLLLGSY